MSIRYPKPYDFVYTPKYGVTQYGFELYGADRAHLYEWVRGDAFHEPGFECTLALAAWLKENCKSHSTETNTFQTGIIIRFTDPTEAVLFQLTWL